VQAAGKVFELFRSRTSEQIQKRIKRRVKRVREKQKTTTGEGEGDALTTAAARIAGKLEAADLLEPVCVIRTTERVNSFGFGLVSHNSDGFSIELLLGLNNNCVEVYNVKSTLSAQSSASGDEESLVVAKKRKRARQVCM
jgi:hypothetical protein